MLDVFLFFIIFISITNFFLKLASLGICPFLQSKYDFPRHGCCYGKNFIGPTLVWVFQWQNYSGPILTTWMKNFTFPAVSPDWETFVGPRMKISIFSKTWIYAHGVWFYSAEDIGLLPIWSAPLHKIGFSWQNISCTDLISTLPTPSHKFKNRI